MTNNCINEIRRWAQRNLATLLLLLFCFLLACFISIKTGLFFDTVNIINILEANSYRLLMALGMMLIISSGAIDLSAGAVLSLSAIIIGKALQAGWPVWLCILLGLFAGAVMGAINGAIISGTRVNAFIITLATAFMFRGVSLIITEGTPITKMPEQFQKFGSGNVLGVENGVFIAAVWILAIYLLFSKMRWGHYVCSLGGNGEALKRCGIRTGPYRISVFMLMGVLAAMAGIIVTARLNSAEVNAGLNMEMDAICAVIMGGTLIHGGKGNLPGTLIAVFLLGMIRNSLTLMSISSYYQQFITGSILLTAVIAAEYSSRKKRIV